MATHDPSRRSISLTSPGAWSKATPSEIDVKPTGHSAGRFAHKDTMYVVLVTGATLKAVSRSGSGVKVLDLGDFAELAHRGADRFAQSGYEQAGDIRLSAIESVIELSSEHVYNQASRFSAALGMYDLAPEKILQAVDRQIEAASAKATESKDSLYRVLSAQEMAALMECSVPVIYQRETAGEFFSALAPGRKNGKRFPAFLVDDKLDRQLMKRVIEAYREAGVGTTLLWSFLRAPQNEFAGQTAVQMLLGGYAPAYEGMSRDERADAIMDVVDEELSRVRPIVQ